MPDKFNTPKANKTRKTVDPSTACDEDDPVTPARRKQTRRNKNVHLATTHDEDEPARCKDINHKSQVKRTIDLAGSNSTEDTLRKNKTKPRVHTDASSSSDTPPERTQAQTDSSAHATDDESPEPQLAVAVRQQSATTASVRVVYTNRGNAKIELVLPGKSKAADGNDIVDSLSNIVQPLLANAGNTDAVVYDDFKVSAYDAPDDNALVAFFVVRNPVEIRAALRAFDRLATARSLTLTQDGVVIRHGTDAYATALLALTNAAQAGLAEFTCWTVNGNFHLRGNSATYHLTKMLREEFASAVYFRWHGPARPEWTCGEHHATRIMNWLNAHPSQPRVVMLHGAPGMNLGAGAPAPLSFNDI